MEKQGSLRTLALNKHTSLTLFFLLSISFGQEYSVTSLLDKDGEVYDLTQKMSINMQDSDIKNVLMLIGELTDLNIRQKMYSEQQNQLEQDMAPFGFVVNGLEEENIGEMVDEYGTKWNPVVRTYETDW